MSLDLLVISVPNRRRQAPGEEFLQKYPRILGQIIKAASLQRTTIMELSRSLTIRDWKYSDSDFGFLNSRQLRQQRQSAEREGGTGAASHPQPCVHRLRASTDNLVAV
jgi:hypothetical protein